jgi:hypothetical protein
MQIDLSLDGIKNAGTKLLSAVSHFHFAGELLEAALGHKVSDDAHKLAKLVSKLSAHTGGKNTFVDEANMIKVKLAGLTGLDGDITASELKVIRGLEEHTNREYGDGFFGDMFYKIFGNKLRPGLLHLTTPDKEVVDKVARVVGKKTVHDEIPRTIPGDDTLLKKYLKYLVREMRTVMRTTVGTKEEKEFAGYRYGLSLLENDGFPALQFAEFAKLADAAIEAFPDTARAAKEKASAAFDATYPVVRDTVKAGSRNINQAVIDRSDRIDARAWYHPLRFFGW